MADFFRIGENEWYNLNAIQRVVSRVEGAVLVVDVTYTNGTYNTFRGAEAEGIKRVLDESAPTKIGKNR